MPSDDLRFPPEPPDLIRHKGSSWRWLVAAAVLVAALAVYWYGIRRTVPRPLANPVDSTASTKPAAAAATTAEPRSDLPALDESDDFLRRHLRSLSASADWTTWLSAEGLARRFAAAALALADGKSPRRALDFISVDGRFSVRAAGGGTVIADASQARYDRFAETVAAIDPASACAAWSALRPLLEDAWREVAPPGLALAPALRRAADHLLATPHPGDDIEVIAQDGLYRFADPRLESASAAQKHLLRMGRHNMERVTVTLRALRGCLDG
jgi:DUF3014 family protein